MSAEDTIQPSNNGCEVYISGLGADATEEEISGIFASYGEIDTCRVKNRSTRAFAFVLYTGPESAQAAIAAQDGQDYNGSTLEVALARAPRKRRKRRELGAESKVQLYVSNLPWSTMDEELNAIFAASGELTECAVVKKRDGRSRGFGFVTFVQEADAANALATLNGHMVEDREIGLQYARELVETKPAAAPAPRAARAREPEPLVGHQLFCAGLPAVFSRGNLRDIFDETYTVVGKPFVSKKKGPNRPRYGFIQLETEEQAEKAIIDLNGAEFENDQVEGDEVWVLKVEAARPRKPRQAQAARPAKAKKKKKKKAKTFKPDTSFDRRVFCKGFPTSYNKDAVTDLFAEFGEIETVRVNKRRSGRSGLGPHSFAHVTFTTAEAADAAVATKNSLALEGEVDEESNPYVLFVEKSRPRQPRTQKQVPTEEADAAVAE